MDPLNKTSPSDKYPESNTYGDTPKSKSYGSPSDPKTHHCVCDCKYCVARRRQERGY